jgi:hypothetical protein
MYSLSSDLSEVQVTAGSSVAVVSWLNTPAELLSNAERIYSVLPDATSTGCYEFPNTFLLGQQAASGCVVTILRKCFDGALVEYFSGVCPTANPTVKPSLPTTATPTVAVTEPPAVVRSRYHIHSVLLSFCVLCFIFSRVCVFFSFPLHLIFFSIQIAALKFI